MTEVKKRKKRKSGPCEVAGCEVRARRYGYCDRHASAFKKYGDPLVSKKAARGKCSLLTCDSPHYMKSFCIKHFRRWEKRGDPNSLGQAPDGTGWISNGYRHIRKNNVTKPEHRWIMEAHLGRELYANEVIHHINEDKLDNRINNLEVMDRGAHIIHHKTGSGKNQRSADIRQCARCRETKSLSEFGDRANYPHGKDIYCRPCSRARSRESATKRRQRLAAL